jgi:hypothetical protein
MRQSNHANPNWLRVNRQLDPSSAPGGPQQKNTHYTATLSLIPSLGA